MYTNNYSLGAMDIKVFLLSEEYSVISNRGESCRVRSEDSASCVCEKRYCAYAR